VVNGSRTADDLVGGLMTGKDVPLRSFKTERGVPVEREIIKAHGHVHVGSYSSGVFFAFDGQDRKASLARGLLSKFQPKAARRSELRRGHRPSSTLEHVPSSRPVRNRRSKFVLPCNNPSCLLTVEISRNPTSRPFLPISSQPHAPSNTSHLDAVPAPGTAHCCSTSTFST
jgi:hypothetical protein